MSSRSSAANSGQLAEHELIEGLDEGHVSVVPVLIKYYFSSDMRNEDELTDLNRMNVR